MNPNRSMEYKGYSAIVDFNADDEVFFGKLWGINDSITFEGESVSELKQSFHDAVDDYLDLCTRIGKEPQKAYKGSFNVRIKPEIHKQAALEAEKCGISLNQFVERAIQTKVYERPEMYNAKAISSKRRKFICKAVFGSTQPVVKRFRQYTEKDPSG